MSGEGQEDSGIPPQADIVAMIEHALLAVRRDQSRRRPPWAEGAAHGHGHGHHGGHWGPPFGGAPFVGQSGGAPFGGMPFGDSARPGPGRRGGRDGSLGRIARVRMLEALEAADAEGRSLSVSGIAAAIGVDQPRASRLVQEGVERGLVRRIPDPSDARRALIQLTTSGRALLGELRTHRRSSVETALAAFTPEEARTFAELFDRFVRAWPRPTPPEEPSSGD
ncbi:MarR family winged helix-turn-helix transcriptional regulator [Leifsonia shinshuensis]|uniref:MarR family winged helix-turn-helix transcriptional regulator n=1 Tax=Leifsonia shinshuensis TaxID=150026 RepID=UPI00285913E6|nr:MarR family winged helix-turn-helix transcriptional regulator [Leifsonia shinshuensis]MDR6971950.1 DNA-binding MarR family transcriptional regulator [Leifsonia shinshuensis]